MDNNAGGTVRDPAREATRRRDLDEARGFFRRQCEQRTTKQAGVDDQACSVGRRREEDVETRSVVESRVTEVLTEARSIQRTASLLRSRYGRTAGP